VQRRGKQIWTEKVAKGTYLGTQLGNIYTGSLYAGLVSLICDETLDLKVTIRMTISEQANFDVFVRFWTSCIPFLFKSQ